MDDPTLILRNGLLLDGSGGPARKADLAMVSGRISAIGDHLIFSGARELDCSGYVVAPGFIDGHSHSDLQILESRREKLLQGVTAEVVGNCGFSAYPQGSHAQQLRSFANGIFCGEGEWGWDSARDYLDFAHRLARNAAVGSLVGHGSLRIAVAGARMDALPEVHVQEMEVRLRDALQQGAIGFSTGLMYAPGSSAPSDELVRLCRVVAQEDKIYCTHMRDYGFHLLDAIEEQLELARRSGCRLQLSHLQAVGVANRDLNARALEMLEEAHVRGVDVAFDCYPYIAGSTVMTQLLPQWSLDGGLDALLLRLSHPAVRSRIADETIRGMANTWDELLVSAVGSDRNASAVGRTLAELAQLQNQSEIDTVFDLLLEERGQVNVLEFNQSEENLRMNLNHPLAIIISDGFYVKGRPHPRLHGTFPELLGNLCRERQWMELPEAIRKITSAPADRFGFAGRGRLQPGAIADVTVFDPATIRSRATYTDPERPPLGIRYVIRGSELLLGPDGQAA